MFQRDTIYIMNQEAQDVLTAITKKEIHELLPSDIVFLRARSSYLTPEQVEKYQSVLSRDVPQRNEPEKEEKIQSKPTTYEQMRYQDLLRQAKSLGIKVKVGIKKDDLIQMIMDITNIF